jgi:hypothetical protein
MLTQIGHGGPIAPVRLRLAATSVLLSLAVFAAAAAATSVSARTAADDVTVLVQLWKSGRAVPGTQTTPPFKLGFSIDAAAGVIQSVTMTVSLPQGIEWGSDVARSGGGLSGRLARSLHTGLTVSGGGTVGGGWFWDVVASRPGTYEVTASVTATEPNPNLSNNTHTLRFEVVQPRTGGSGAGTVSTSAAKLSPAKPKAGRVVSATVRVTAGGAPVRPSAVACTATAGGVKLKGVPKARVGFASCAYRPPLSAMGKTLAEPSRSPHAARASRGVFSAKLG